METSAPRMTGILVGCDLAELRVVRRFVHAALPGLSENLTYLIQLCATELVTNAILHSDTGAKGDTIMVLAIEYPDRVRVEVLDSGSTVNRPRVGVGVDLGSETGRGLFIVERLCAARGTFTDPEGQNSWFEFMVR
ncbi:MULTISPECIES: ATP-binding protein [Actinomadura]|uniref:ATP-binding protein n=1 Tax=Actinomadura TaxID=1988 RepID=UPI001BE43601|nr:MULTISPECIES: ATP-binding protein [Actinomadura]MBT2206551.1 ATP-binding protein [Actinomadura sp. NEAU-AAG7]